MDCLFCNIMNGSVPSYTIYEDEIVKCFLDINPDSNGHMLIVPKKHIYDLNDMDETTWTHILKIAKKMRKLIEERLKPDGLTLIQNNGEVQMIKHFHLHLKPYYKDHKPISIEEIYQTLTK